MDRNTVRIILLVIGVLVIAGVYVWGRYKDRLLDFINRRGEYDELGFDDDIDAQPAPNEPDADEAFQVRHFVPTDVREDIIVEELDDDDYEFPRATPQRPAEVPEPSKTAPLGAPFLIQLSVVASGDGFFNGEDLRDALTELDLIYGDMGIYHRYDREYRNTLFGVASLVEPGTFPIDDMENFECPGVVLFFQPPQVDDPIAVFDDLVNTARELANRLDGEEWDERRQPLTVEKLHQMRQRLEEAY